MNKKLQLGHSSVIRLLGPDTEGFASEMAGTRVYTNTGRRGLEIITCWTHVRSGIFMKLY